MLSAIKKFLSSSSPSKNSPSHSTSQQHNFPKKATKIASTVALSQQQQQQQMVSLGNFNFEKQHMEEEISELENYDVNVISDDTADSAAVPNKKRSVDSVTEHDDPFTDKENRLLGENFMRIPDLLTKKRKASSASSDRLKYALSIAKPKPNNDKRNVERSIREDDTNIIEENEEEVGSTATTQEDPQSDNKDDETEEEVIVAEEEEQEEQGNKGKDDQTDSTKENYNQISDSVREEIENIKLSFKNLDRKYKLIDKIGEGTFSTVYKARVLTPEIQNINLWNSPPIKGKSIIKKRYNNKKTSSSKKIKYVALKRIYVTSSPQRIYNELNLLYTLTGCSKVAPLIDAIRHQDQVIAVLPYYRHSDFRYFYRDLSIDGIKIYMFELLSALSFVHSHHIIHRDVKPTNFLYDPFKRRGVLVDFGLAEKELILDSTNTSNCLCYRNHHNNRAHESYQLQTLASDSHLKGYPKDDSRPGRRANRAGTRGFRAPEVLFKCANQTSKIDIWSAGVVLLTLLTRRFTFFNSPDDVDALVELTTLFGYESMRKCANLHGLGIDSSINKVKANSGYPMSQIIQWAVHLDASNDTFAEDSPALQTLEAIDSHGRIKKNEIGLQFKDAINLLDRCFEMNPYERITADDALNMPFFKELRSDTDEDVNLD